MRQLAVGAVVAHQPIDFHHRGERLVNRDPARGLISAEDGHLHRGPHQIAELARRVASGRSKARVGADDKGQGERGQGIQRAQGPRRQEGQNGMWRPAEKIAAWKPVSARVPFVLERQRGTIREPKEATLRRNLEAARVQPGVEWDQTKVRGEVERRSRVARLVEEHAFLIVKAVPSAARTGVPNRCEMPSVSALESMAQVS